MADAWIAVEAAQAPVDAAADASIEATTTAATALKTGRCAWRPEVAILFARTVTGTVTGTKEAGEEEAWLCIVSDS